MGGREPEDLALVRKGRRSAKTIRGEKLLLASWINPVAAQHRSKRTVVGADVESLFPSLDDLETANACYKAILDTQVGLDNFNYKKDPRVCRHALHRGRSTGQPPSESPTHKGARPEVTGPWKKTSGTTRTWRTLTSRGN